MLVANTTAFLSWLSLPLQSKGHGLERNDAAQFSSAWGMRAEKKKKGEYFQRESKQHNTKAHPLIVWMHFSRVATKMRWSTSKMPSVEMAQMALRKKVAMEK